MTRSQATALVPIAFILCVLGWPAVTQAADPATASWTLAPKESTLNFVARQEGQDVEGGFASFGGSIVFDPAKLDQAKIDMTIDVTSVTSSYDEIPATLKGSDWFDTTKFPKAQFVATKIRIDGQVSPQAPLKTNYIADGTLTLRSVSVPVSVAFHFDSYGPKSGQPEVLRAVAKGKATLSRTAFGVGQGEWKSTKSVADPVQVDFILTAERR